MSQAAAFGAQSSATEVFCNSMENHHVALAGQQQKKSYNTTYRTREDQSTTGNNQFAKPGMDRRQFYCEHCKMHGNSIQRCYKIHGYPPGHKLHNRGKKVTAIVQTDTSSEVVGPQITSSSLGQYNLFNQAPVPGLIAEQYAQLMALLYK